MFSLRRSFLSPRAASLPTRAFSSSPIAHTAKLTLTGRLGADPEVRATSTGQEIVNYLVGTDTHGPKDDRQTSWFRVSYFARDNESLNEYMKNLKKGSLVYVEGDAMFKAYEDAEGKPKSALNIVHRSIEVLQKPKESA